jgi:hypothetical protein
MRSTTGAGERVGQGGSRGTGNPRPEAQNDRLMVHHTCIEGSDQYQPDAQARVLPSQTLLALGAGVPDTRCDRPPAGLPHRFASSGTFMINRPGGVRNLWGFQKYLTEQRHLSLEPGRKCHCWRQLSRLKQQSRKDDPPFGERGIASWTVSCRLGPVFRPPASLTGRSRSLAGQRHYWSPDSTGADSWAVRI